MASIDAVAAKFGEFKKEFDKPDANLDKCHALLSELKIAMTQFSFLLPTAEPSPQTLKQVLIAREILEHAILLAVKRRDTESFERQIAQVKTYYFDTSRLFKDIPPSSYQYQILGLNLLRLLALNRIAEFHTELELIPLDKHDNIYIKHPIQLEQYIMEGSYNKVFSAAKDLPAPSYSFFIEYLMDLRLKDEIAECSEKSYVSLPVAAGQKLLNFRSQDDFVAYAKQRGWEVKNGRVDVQKKEEDNKAQVPSLQIIAQTLQYVKELERIV